MRKRSKKKAPRQNRWSRVEQLEAKRLLTTNAVADAFTVDEDMTLSGSVLADNGSGADTDDTGATLTVDTTAVTAPTNGSLTLKNDGTFQYTPNPNFFGTDSFKYSVTGSTTDVGLVSITVNAVNDPPTLRDVHFTIAEDSPFTIIKDANGVGLISGHEYGVDDPLDFREQAGVTGLGTPQHGETQFSAFAGQYRPAPNFNGTDTFTYTLTDRAFSSGETGLSSTANVFVTVTPVNDAPEAKADAFSGAGAITGNVLSDNGNGADLDIDGDALSVEKTPVTGPVNGSLVLNTDGSFTYTPNSNFSGTDSFQYRLTDGAATSVATVSLTVTGGGGNTNQSPVAKDDAVATNEDQAMTGNVLADNGNGVDKDADGDTLTVNTTPTVAPTKGSLVLAANGTFTYTPNANANGADSFQYQVSDGKGGTDTATVSIQIIGVNDNPVANADAFTTAEDTAVSGNVLVDNGSGADSDVDGDTLSVTLKTDAANGTVQLNANGTFTYTPDAGFNGTDSFAYTLSDGNGGTASGSATVVVSGVNDAPVAKDDTVSGTEDAAVAGNVLADNGNGADSDPDGDALAVSVNVAPANGTLQLQPGGAFTYTPNANFNGTDTFTYNLSDGNGGSDIGTVTVQVAAVNDLPVAKDDSATTTQGNAVSGNVLADNGNGADSDVEAATLTVNTTPVTAPLNGTVQISANGDFTYTPNASFSGNDSFEYQVTDSDGGTATATVSIAVSAVANRAPVAKDDTFTINEDSALSGNVLIDNGGGADSDADGDTLKASGPISAPANGTVTVSSNGTFNYTPNANFNGVDTFTYRVSDAEGASDTATVTVNVTAVNDTPIAKNDEFAVDAGNTLQGDVLADNGRGEDKDPDGQGLTVTAGALLPTLGQLTLNQNGTFTYKANAGASGTDVFNYTITDGNGDTDSGQVSIVVREGQAVSAPKVTGFSKNDGRDLHHVLDSLSFTFDSDVGASISADDLVLIGSNGQVVDTSSATVQWNADGNLARWNLSSLDLDIDRYTVRLLSSGIEAGNRHLDGDSDGQGGDNYNTEAILTWQGDANLDFQVNFTDFLAVSQNFTKTNRDWAQGDFDGDNVVKFSDFLALSQNFAKKKVVPSSAEAAAAAAQAQDDAMAEEDDWLN